MKLTIIGPVYPYRGGISHHTAMLSGALNRSGHQTQVISFERQYPSWLYPGKSDKDPSQKPQQVEACYLLDPFYPWTWIKAFREIQDYQPNGVIIQWWTTFWAVPFAVLAKLLHAAHIPAIFLIHNVLPHEERAFDKQLACLALSQGNAFIVQTKSEVDRLKELIGERSIAFCRHPDYSFFRSGQIDQQQAREVLNIPRDHYTLLFFGLIRPYKGLEILLEALGILRNHHQYPTLLIAGEFWDSISAYEEKIKELDLQKQVVIYNRYIPDEEVETIFAAADCLVVPYTGGTQSGAATIASSFGMRLIVTEQIAEGIDKNNLSQMMQIVRSGDPAALAEAIQNDMNSTEANTPEGKKKLTGWENLVDTIVGFINPCTIIE